MKKLPSKRIVGVDLFCGAGGLTHGLTQGGIDIKVGVDLDGDCRFPFEKNNSAIFLQKDVRKLMALDIKPFFFKWKN